MANYKIDYHHRDFGTERYLKIYRGQTLIWEGDPFPNGIPIKAGYTESIEQAYIRRARQIVNGIRIDEKVYRQ